MKELIEYRKLLVARLVSETEEFREACLSIQEPTVPLGKDGWSVHQIATHTRDVHNLVYSIRARQTVQEDNPEFQSFDSETYMAEHYTPNESLKAILDDFVVNVKDLAEFLSTLPDEAWSRLSRHTTFGSGFTLQTWIERDLAHIEEHLEIVKKETVI